MLLLVYGTSASDVKKVFLWCQIYVKIFQEWSTHFGPTSDLIGYRLPMNVTFWANFLMIYGFVVALVCAVLFTLFCWSPKVSFGADLIKDAL